MPSLIGSARPKSKGFRRFLRAIGCGSPSPFSSRPLSPQPLRSQDSVLPTKTNRQSSSAPLGISVGADDPQSFTSPDETHTVTNPKDETTVTHMAWAGAGITLEMLRGASGACAPLATATEILHKFFDMTETDEKNRQDYDDLATDLAAIDNTSAKKTFLSNPFLLMYAEATLRWVDFDVGLDVHMSIEHFQASAVLQVMFRIIDTICRGVEQQAKEIEGKQRRRKGTQWLLANDDEGDVNLNMSTWSMEHEEFVRKQLKALDPTRQAEYDSGLSETISRRTCTKGTRKKVLSDITNWLQDPTSPAVCWMSGMAGTGKTTIACTLAEWLEREHLLGASFFCTRTSVDCRDVRRIIPTIAYQLARYSIPFQSTLCDAPTDSLDAGSKNLAKQFEELLKNPLLKAKSKAEVNLSPTNHTKPNNLVVVIDALDECDDQARVKVFLDVLFEHAPNLPLKFFITSRPEPEIHEKMRQKEQSREAIYLQDIEDSLLRADIELYLREGLKPMSPFPPDSDVEQLVERSGTLFIYAATLVRHIDPDNPRIDPHERLQSLLETAPTEMEGQEKLDDLYTKVLESALSQKTMNADEKERVQLVLYTVLHAQEPIGIKTIAELSTIDEPSRVEVALRSLRSVLYQSEATGLVSTLHASFPDFMFDSKRARSYCADAVKHGHLLGMRCFAIMKTELQFNICHLQSSLIPDEKVQNIQNRIEQKISPTLAYTCRYWASHLPLAPISQDFHQLLRDFLSERLLFWMEVMTLRRVMITGIDVLLNAKERMVEADPVPSNLMLWLEDAVNFVTSYAANSVSLSTPHIYISALALCPRSNAVYKHYSKRMRGLLELKGSVMERRDGAPQAHWNIGLSVRSLAYAPDGTRVAVGGGDGTVGIRSPVDGASLVGPLQGHTRYINSITFSPNGKLLANGFNDNTIRLWDVFTGDLVAGPFETLADVIASLSFSPDGKRLVCGSWDKTIRVLDATTGTLLLGPLEAHDDYVNSVSFSPDGSLIASASSDKTIRLWHSHDGSPASSPFQGHTHRVESISFTPDGTRLVSGSWDKTVRVWNVSDGSSAGHPFEGHTEFINSVAVSTDGTRVASCSYDGTVRVWKIEDGTLIAGPLVGDNRPLYSVAFSPDGTRVIAGSGSGILMWNVREGVHPPILSALQSAVSEIDFVKLSSDGSSIVSCSHDKAIHIWDLSDGSFTQDPHQPPFKSTSFSDTSPDGTFILGKSEKGKVQIVHKTDGSLVAGPFDVDQRSLSAFRFSHDSTSVIMCCKDGTIQVRRLAGGEAPGCIFNGHRRGIRSIDQSPNGLLLVSYSGWDSSMRVWDMVAPVLQLEFLPTSSPACSLDHSPSTVYDGWHVKEDGWVVNKNNQLLFWLPPDIAVTKPSPYASLIITTFGVLIIPEQKVFVGEQWWRCYVGDAPRGDYVTPS